MNIFNRLIYKIGKAIAQDEPQTNYRSLLQDDRAIKIEIAKSYSFDELAACEHMIKDFEAKYLDLQIAMSMHAICLRNRITRKETLIAKGIHIDCSQLTLN